MEFDTFFTQLFEESKYLFEKSKESQEPQEKNIYLHSSLLLAMSSLEACINAIIEELLIEPYDKKYSLLEQSVLLEKDIVFRDGIHKLGNSLKISRLIDKIELLFAKLNNNPLESSETWVIQLKQSIDVRNKLVHPKATLSLSEKQVEIAIHSVLETINELYKLVYKRNFPSYLLGLASKL